MFLKIKRKGQSTSALMNMPDETLVSRYCETGDKAFVAELFERYTHLVYGICLNYLQEPEQSKDAVMDIFESLFLKLAQHHISNFRNWLYSVTRNQCLMIIRKSGTVNRAKDKLKLKTAGNDADSLDEDNNLFIHQGMIESAVEKLNTEQGTCIRLMYLEDKSYKDISAITGYSFGEVKSYIQNGKRNLRIYLRNNHDSTGE